MVAKASSFARHWPLLLSMLLMAASLILFWPGIVSYDAVGQYAQAMTGRYDDWHPPVMARLWSLFRPAEWRASPMLLLQMAGYWLGFGWVAQALSGWRRIAVLATALFPPLLGWQGVIVKDSHLMAAMLLATGLILRSRLRGSPMSLWQRIVVAILVGYALLVRANAVFAVIPFAVLAAVQGPLRVRHAVAVLGGIGLVLAVSPVINHGLLGAQDSGVQRTVPLYDLAGIAVRIDKPVAGLAPGSAQALVQSHCVKPLFWDPLGSRDQCMAAIHPLDRDTPGHLYRLLASTAVAHPFAYLAHRFAHFNSTERWLVGGHWPLAVPPSRTEPNRWDLPDPHDTAVLAWMAVAGILVGTPLCWPIVWTFAGAVGLRLCWRGQSVRESMARALFASAIVQEASFLAISISSDLRYHLWSMVAVMLGWLVTDRRGSKSLTVTTAVGALFIVATGTAARWVLPTAPANYADLIK